MEVEMPKSWCNRYKNLTELLVTIYSRLPKIFRQYILPPFDLFFSRILQLTQSIYIHVYVIDGKERLSNSGLKILFCGDEISLIYISNILFSEKHIQKKIKKIFVWNIKKLVGSHSDAIDAIFVKTDTFFSHYLKKRGFIIMPEWIDGKIDTSKPLDEIYDKFSKGTKSDIKRIKIQDYSYEISTHPDKLMLYYKRMFLPYMEKRYKNLIPKSYLIYTKILLDRCKVLLVKRKNHYVAGGIIAAQKDIALLPSMGILDGNIEYLKKGASVALEFFYILWAKRNGIKLLDFGDARPFFNDGGFRYKKKWGMSMSPSNYMYGVFGIKILNNTAEIKNFLKKNPFIYLDNNQLKGFIFMDKNEHITRDEIQGIIKSYYIPGLTQISIISPSGFVNDVKELDEQHVHSRVIQTEFLGQKVEQLILKFIPG